MAFVAAYLPISNLFSLNATAAEHWLYVPSAFLLLAAALSIEHALTRKQVGPAPIFALAAGWMIFLGSRAFIRNADWHDDRRFLESAIRDGGDSARMLINLGSLESSEGHFGLAIEDFNSALRRAPNKPFARLGLAAAYIRMRDFPHAREQLNDLSRVAFVRAEYLDYMATLEYQEKGADRLDLLEEAARLGSWAAEKQYISHLAERGDKMSAIKELQRVLEREPFRAETWKMLGKLLEPNRPDLAKMAYGQASEYDAHDEDSRAALALLSGGVR